MLCRQNRDRRPSPRESLREPGRCLGAWSAAPLRLGLVPVLEIAVVAQGLGVPRLQSLESWTSARSPTERNWLQTGTTEGRISAAAKLCVDVAGAFGSWRADAFGPSRCACKISSVVVPWLVRTLAVTPSPIVSCKHCIFHQLFG